MPNSVRSTGVLVSVLLAALLVFGCSQIPTEKQSAVDMRPQISFKIVNENVRGARVLVDGLDMGSVDEYQENQAALKVLPGKHVVSIVQRDQLVYEESIYVGHGISRAIVVQ